ncbi:MAG: efflux RND transporter periplasmic adaptor subunit [Candidatus Zixiibacteriota bacterium]|nr:MAG: efflux RND transporter periplasmic adaptor subunit [candidate division Zixibacteria bacterium]
MDREISPEVTRKRKIKIYTRVAAGVVILIALSILFRSLLTPTISRSRISTCRAEIGPIEATVTASGIVIPAFEQAITSPIPSQIEEIYVKAGESVNENQPILRLNKEFIQITLNRLKDELELQKNKRTRFDSDLLRAESELQAQYDIKELQTRYLENDLEREKHLFDIGGSTKSSVARAELSVEISRKELHQLASKIVSQKASLKADSRELDLQIRIQENRLEEVSRQMDLADAKSDRNGVITWVNDRIGSTVNAGEIIARVADLRSFQIDATISEVHAARLTPGAVVRIRLNDQSLGGHVESVKPSVKEGVMSFMVSLDDSGNRSLRPNLRTDVFVVTGSRDSVLRVANGPFYSGLRDQTVFVIDGNKAKAHKVDIGASNIDWVELLGDIRPGDEVIVSDMRKYQNMTRLSIQRD